MMTTPNDLDGRLRAELIESVSDVHADMFTVNRLIETAKQEVPTRTSRRVWIAPMLAAAAVVAIVTVTTAVVATSNDADHPAPPLHSNVTAPVPTPTPDPTSTPVQAGNDVLGPDGLGALKLGMNRQQAMATGEVGEVSPTENQCDSYKLVGAPATVTDGYLSHSLGIALIVPPANVRTPEGIGIGSSIADVMRAYPGTVYNISTRQNLGPRVLVPGNPNAYYRFPDGGTGKVTRISIELKNQDCFD